MLKRLGIVSHQVVGVPDVQGWSQIQVVVPLGKNLGLVLLMSLLGISDEIATQGNQWLQTLVNDFEKTHLPPLEWLKKNISWFGDQVGSGGQLVALIVTLGRENNQRRALYVGGWGDVFVQLERNGARNSLLNNSGGQRSVSGWIQEGDLITAGTDNFMGKIWGNLGGDILSRVEEAQGRVGGLDLAGLMAGVVLHVQDLPLLEEETEQKVVTISEAPVVSHPIPVIEVVEDEPALEVPSVTVAEPLEESIPSVEHKTSPLEKITSKLGFLNRFKPTLHLKSDTLQGKPVKKISFLAVLLLLGLLLVSIVLGGWQRKQAAAQAEFDAVLSPLQHSLTEATALQSVNPVRARSLVMDIKSSIASQGKRFDNTRFADDWKKFANSVSTTWVTVSGEKQVDGKMWLDLDIVRDNTQISNISLLDDKKMVVLDQNGGVVLAVSLADKNSWIAGGGSDLSGASALSGWPDKGLVFTPKGIVQVDTVAKSTKQILSASDENWESPLNLAGFGTSLYVLAKQDIWKYPGVNGSLGKRLRWLKPGVQPDFSGSTDWQIDGQVWVLTNGKLSQYDQGKATAFVLKDADPGFKFSKFTFSTKRKELFLLDSTQGRVVTFDRDSGEYKNQLVWSGFAGATDLVVDDERDRLLVSKANGIYEVKLD